MYFNHRILQEASKQDLPPLERLSFLGICSNNLDEFFRVRMASLNRIEVMAPVYDEDMQRDLLRTIDFALADNTNARIVDGHGGNINKLYKLSKNKLPERSVAMDEVKDIYNRLKALSVEERIEQFGLKADRADVIIPASEIFITIADALGCDRVQVPNICLADCITDGLYRGKTAAAL